MWVYILYDTNYLHEGVGMTSDFREGEPVWFTIGTVFMSGLHHWTNILSYYIETYIATSGIVYVGHGFWGEGSWMKWAQLKWKCWWIKCKSNVVLKRICDTAHSLRKWDTRDNAQNTLWMGGVCGVPQSRLLLVISFYCIPQINDQTESELQSLEWI